MSRLIKSVFSSRSSIGKLTTIIHVFTIMLFITTLTLTFGCAKETKDIKIGAILPLTGDMAKFGESFKNGIDLAVDEINSENGIYGANIQIIYEDDTGEGKQAVSAFRKLINQDKVQSVIGGVMSSTAMPIAPIAEENKIILFSPTATAPALSKYKEYFFRIQPSDNYEGKVMAEFVYKQLNATEVALFYVNNDWGQGLTEVFKNELITLGGRISIEDNYELGDTDFRTQITKIKSVSPEYLYLLGYLQELSIILRQIRELGLKSRILSAYSFHDPKLLQISAEVAEDAIFTMPTYDPESKDPQVTEFVKRYMAKYKEEPDMFAAHSYDCIKILEYVMQKGALEGTEISIYLHNLTDYPGVTGKTTFDVNGDVIKPLKFFTVRNGQFIPYTK